MTNSVEGDEAVFRDIPDALRGSDLTIVPHVPCYQETPHPTKISASRIVMPLSLTRDLSIRPSGTRFTAVEDEGYAQAFTLSGGTGSYQLSLDWGTKGAVPGLSPSIHSPSVTLAGSPGNVGEFGFTVTGRDGCHEKTEEFLINVVPPKLRVNKQGPPASSPKHAVDVYDAIAGCLASFFVVQTGGEEQSGDAVLKCTNCTSSAVQLTLTSRRKESETLWSASVFPGVDGAFDIPKAVEDWCNAKTGRMSMSQKFGSVAGTLYGERK
jgi:hypothetical protein